MHQQLSEESKQNTLLVTIQKVRYSLSRTLATILILTSAGVLGRVAFQYIPSVEPLTPLAILSGFIMGPINGFVAGASGFYLSNYLVWDGQGPWTLFQMAGAGIAGFLGGVFGKVMHNKFGLIISTILSIAIYEILVNIGGSLTFAFIPLPVYFITSMPFSVIHLISSLGFVVFFYEFKGLVEKLRGEIIEKRIFGLRRAVSGDSIINPSYAPFFYFKERRDDKGKSNSILWSRNK